MAVVLGLGRDPDRVQVGCLGWLGEHFPDQEQVGRLGWLGEHLPGKVVEGHHRLGKALSLGGFGLAG